MEFIAKYELKFRRKHRYIMAAPYPNIVSLNIQAMNLKSCEETA